MKNLDMIQKSRAEFAQKMLDAAKSDDAEGMAQAMTDFATELQQAIITEAKELANTNDVAILAQRGVRQLTKDETEYYQKAINAMRSAAPKQALAELDVVLPKTTVDAIFENLQDNHPLLAKLDFQNTEVLTEILVSSSSGVAVWGELTAEVKGEIEGAFDIIPLAHKKLTAYMPVCIAMLDLGPRWLDKYVRVLLAEALATGLEQAIVDGDGSTGPRGMTRASEGATDGIYPRKKATKVTSFDPTTYGAILAKLSKGSKDTYRAIGEVLLIVNPEDYFTKVFPATTAMTASGQYAKDLFPFPTDTIQSASVPKGYAVMGLGKHYFVGLGTGKGGKIEYSDDAKFLEDIRLYKIKLYGNGCAKDDNAFQLLDISGLKPTNLKVEVVGGATK